MLKLLLTAWLLLGMHGCTSVEPMSEPLPVELTLTLQATQDTNRNLFGRPSPVWVQVFQLADSRAFEAASLAQLSPEPGQFLQADLLAEQRFQLRPGQQLLYRFTALEQTRNIGVIAEYRDVDRVRWRALTPVGPGLPVAMQVSVGRYAIEFTSALSIEQQRHE